MHVDCQSKFSWTVNLSSPQLCCIVLETLPDGTFPLDEEGGDDGDEILSAAELDIKKDLVLKFIRRHYDLLLKKTELAALKKKLSAANSAEETARKEVQRATISADEKAIRSATVILQVIYTLTFSANTRSRACNYSRV